MVEADLTKDVRASGAILVRRVEVGILTAFERILGCSEREGIFSIHFANFPSSISSFNCSIEREKEEMSEVLLLVDLTFHTTNLKNKEIERSLK